MREFFEVLRELFTFKRYSSCRCCGVPVKNNGVYIQFIGAGFCNSCAVQILRK